MRLFKQQRSTWKMLYTLINSYLIFFSELRTEEIFLELLKEARRLKEEEYEDEQWRTRISTLGAGESRNKEVFLGGREKLKIEIYYAVLDRIQKKVFQLRANIAQIRFFSEHRPLWWTIEYRAISSRSTKFSKILLWWYWRGFSNWMHSSQKFHSECKRLRWKI